MALLSLSRWRIAVLSKFQLVRPELGLYAHHQAGDYLHVGSHRFTQNPSKSFKRLAKSGNIRSAPKYVTLEFEKAGLLESFGTPSEGRWEVNIIELPSCWMNIG